MTYENEYKERAYQWWKYCNETNALRPYMLLTISNILSEDTDPLFSEFEARYESEYDSIKKIREDANKPGYGLNIRTDKDAAEWALDLIDRTVKVMERDEQ